MNQRLKALIPGKAKKFIIFYFKDIAHMHTIVHGISQPCMIGFVTYLIGYPLLDDDIRGP